MTATNRQRHCKSRNVSRKRSCAGNTAGAATSNLPTPYSEFPKTCKIFPIVLLVIPIVPGGGGSGSTGTGQPTASSSDSASGEISLFTIGSAMPRAAEAMLRASGLIWIPARRTVDNLIRERDAHLVEIHMPHHRID